MGAKSHDAQCVVGVGDDKLIAPVGVNVIDAELAVLDSHHVDRAGSGAVGRRMRGSAQRHAGKHRHCYDYGRNKTEYPYAQDEKASIYHIITLACVSARKVLELGKIV